MNIRLLEKMEKLLENNSYKINEDLQSFMESHKTSERKTLQKYLEMFSRRLTNEIRSRCPKIFKQSDALSSGCMAWIGTLIFLGLYAEKAPAKAVVGIVMIYILVDFTLDSMTSESKLIIGQLKTLMDHLKTDQSYDDIEVFETNRLILEYIDDILENSCGSREETISCLIYAWETELDSSKQIGGKNLQEVLRLTEAKGAATVELIGKVCILKNEPDLKGIGAITQLLDDLIDKKKDIAVSISTGATLFPNTDEYLEYIMNKIDRLPTGHDFVKWIFCSVLCNSGFRSDAVSSDLRKILGEYCAFKETINIEDLFLFLA